MKVIFTIVLLLMTIGLTACGILLWRRRKETGDYSRHIQAIFSWLSALTTFVFIFRTWNESLVVDATLFEPEHTFVPLLMQMTFFLYPLEVIRTSISKVKVYAMLLAPMLILVFVGMCAGIKYTTLNNYADLWLHLGEFNVWFRIFAICTMLFYCFSLFLVPYDWRRSSVDKKFIMATMLSFTMGSCDNGEAVPDEQASVDYSDTNNWVKISTAEKAVDVFYLYPTSWEATEEDNIINTIDNASMRAKVPGVYEEQASCFESVANVYAPYYRQLDAMKLLNYPLEEQEEMVAGTPYSDAKAAFEYYLEHYNCGRPFILAGHSQGSNVLKYLLSDYMADHPEVYGRMIAAYPLGYSYSQDYFEENTHLKFAEGETDTRVVISWNCERMENGEFGSYNLVCHEGAMSINPISWKHDYEKVEADDPRNLGALSTRERYSAQVMYDPVRKYEVLIVGMPEQPENEQGIGEYALHGCDFKLYYYNIAENAQKRIDTYFSEQE